MALAISLAELMEMEPGITVLRLQAVQTFMEPVQVIMLLHPPLLQVLRLPQVEVAACQMREMVVVVMAMERYLVVVAALEIVAVNLIGYRYIN